MLAQFDPKFNPNLMAINIIKKPRKYEAPGSNRY